MPKKRYVTIQIIPEDSSEAWTIKLRFRFFEFLFYAIIIALFAVALAAVKVTEINGKVLSAEHLAATNRQLMEKQEKMTLLERELEKLAEQEKRIRGIVQTFLTEQGMDSGTGKTREHGNRLSPQDLDRFVAEARALEKKARAGGAARERDNVPDIWPVTGIISQPFNSGAAAGSLHEGMDIIAEANTLVASAASGIVLEAAWDRDLGKFIRIDHDFRLQTLYAHLSRTFVQAGDRVAKGSSIGAVGNTGNSFGPHLHFEILVNGKNVDPQQFLK